jgi:hypothetical protein
MFNWILARQAARDQQLDQMLTATATQEQQFERFLSAFSSAYIISPPPREPIVLSSDPADEPNNQESE